MGEPTLVDWLSNIVSHCKKNHVKHIAISSNGSADQTVYENLLRCGVNDFSISLDACCASIGDMMAGNITGIWDKIVSNIKFLASKTYVTVGIVLTKETVNDVNNIIKYASDELGVADIRIISSAQWNGLIDNIDINQKYLDKYPILKYRWKNIKNNKNVRGLNKNDCHTCMLMFDDVAVVGDEHFPCIIHLREGGKPIGKVGNDMRAQRIAYAVSHDTHNDIICKNNCLDVCIDYNNRYYELNDKG